MKKLIAAIKAGTLGLSLMVNALFLLGGKAIADREHSIGKVDVTLLAEQFKQSPEWERMLSSFEDNRVKFREEMTRLTKQRYLTDEERNELARLKGDPTPTRSERRRIEALEAKSNGLDQEFQRLATLERPNEQQRIRSAELQRLRERRLETLKDAEQSHAQRLAQGESDMLDAQNRRIEKAAEAVAAERRLDLVLDRQSVLFGGMDVTKDVLAHLQAK